jgi:hypothetical protein
MQNFIFYKMVYLVFTFVAKSSLESLIKVPTYCLASGLTCRYINLVLMLNASLYRKDYPRPTSCKQDLLSWAFCTQDLDPDLEYRYVNRSYAHLGYRFHSDTVRH